LQAKRKFLLATFSKNVFVSAESDMMNLLTDREPEQLGGSERNQKCSKPK